MSRTIILTLVVGFLTVCPSEAQVQNRDGNWWLGLAMRGTEREILSDFLTRTWYLDGLITGVAGFSNNLLLEAMVAESIDPQTAAMIQSAYLAAWSAYIVNTNIGQVSDGLDAFYADFRNRRISVSNAVSIVFMQIGGASDDLVQRSMEAFRQAAAPR